jgi:hypothetical protein
VCQCEYVPPFTTSNVAGWKASFHLSLIKSIVYIGYLLWFPGCNKEVWRESLTMSLKNKIIVFGAIVAAVAGLGLALSTLQNTATVVASAVWGY